VTRLRATGDPDPYDPSEMVSDWRSRPQELRLGLCAWRSEPVKLDLSEQRGRVERRAQIGVCDPDADVRLGDRVRRDRDGSVWTVVELVPGDRSPFTGWRPGQVLTVEPAAGRRRHGQQESG
jgi:hypothetical protein